MIYIFRVVSEACACPYRTCSALCELSNRLLEFRFDCDGSRRSCGACVKACADAVIDSLHFAEKPLGSFVFINAILSFADIYFCVRSLTDRRIEHCIMNAPMSISSWLSLQIMFACINLFYALYLQSRLVGKLSEMSLASDLRRSSRKQIRAAFREVFLYDAGVLIYFISSLGAWAWCWFGSEWISTGINCDPNQSSSSAYSLGFWLLGVSLAYTLIWYRCSCFSTFRLSGPESRDAEVLQAESPDAVESNASVP